MTMVGMDKKIARALVSVYSKEGLEPIVRKLNELGVELVSTGGTYDFIKNLGLPATPIEALTHTPEMLHGRVKTLHPTIFGGILAQREDPSDRGELEKYGIQQIDLVIVDLYPFEETLQSGASEEEIIEKIDIGGVSLIRAAAKNFHDVLVVASRRYYPRLESLLEAGNGVTTLVERQRFARAAFGVTSAYDTAIFSYFDEDNLSSLRIATDSPKVLRYGENPHQKGVYYGDLERYFDILQGKELSYNNLQDIDAAVRLMNDFQELPTFAVLKHTNPCGLASRKTIVEAYQAAYEADPESIFGGILIANRSIDKATAEAIGSLFFEILIAPDFDTESLPLLSKKTKRILLLQKDSPHSRYQVRSALGGYLLQEEDSSTESETDCQVVTLKKPTENEFRDCLFAQKVVKHCKSNAIVIVKDQQVLASGIGQTSRISALKQAIDKASRFGFALEGAVMASDAFFPFPDCVETAHEAGITALIEPGGSLRDQQSIDTANNLGVAMLFSGVRHFKH